MSDEQESLFESRPNHFDSPVLYPRELDNVPTEPANPTQAEHEGTVAIEPKRATDAAEILARLRQGPASNGDLVEICLRYGSRLYDLRQLGHKIATKRLGGGVFTYELVRETGLRTRGEAGP